MSNAILPLDHLHEPIVSLIFLDLLFGLHILKFHSVLTISGTFQSGNSYPFALGNFHDLTICFPLLFLFSPLPTSLTLLLSSPHVLSLEHLFGCWTWSPNYSPLFSFLRPSVLLYERFTQLYLLVLLILLKLKFFTSAIIFLISKSSLPFLEFSHHIGSSSCFMNALSFLRIQFYICVYLSSPYHVSSKCLFCYFNHPFDIRVSSNVWWPLAVCSYLRVEHYKSNWKVCVYEWNTSTLDSL